MSLDRRVNTRVPDETEDDVESVFETEVYIEDEQGPDNFFMSIYFNKDEAGENFHVQRKTEANREDYEELAVRMMDDPNLNEVSDKEVRAVSGASRIRWSSGYRDNIFLYSGKFTEQELQDFYVEGSEPLPRSEYEQALDEGLADIRSELEENGIDPKTTAL